VRKHHPFEGQLLPVMGWTHRDGLLQLTLVLPDGTRSLIPATWTDLNNAGAGTVSSSPALLGSVSDLSRTCYIVDALLRRLDPLEPKDENPSKEGSQRATTTGVLAHGGEHPRAATSLGKAQPRAASEPNSCTRSTDLQDDLSTTRPQDSGEQP
jgi:hypothetical protein